MTNIEAQRILPLAVPQNEQETEALGSGLVAGGVGAVEVGLRHPYALEAIRTLAASGQPLLVGAGTVRTVADADAAFEAGATFLVSPGLSVSVAKRAAELGLPFIPGVATATEVMQACDLGLTRLKLFPAHLVGGLAAISAMHSVFPEVTFVPSGGVSKENLAEFLSHPAVGAVSGSWITSGVQLGAGAEAVAKAAAEASATVHAVYGNAR